MKISRCNAARTKLTDFHGAGKFHMFLSPSKETQGGASALVLSALLLLLSGGLIGTYYVANSSRTQVLENQQQVDSLNEAVASITGFTLANGRLPCVAEIRDGAENCSAGQKGWYPTRTLQQFSSANSTRSANGLRYAISARLAQAGMGIAEYKPSSTVLKKYPDIKSSLDFCQAVRSLALPSDGGRWTTGDGIAENAADTSLIHVPLPAGPIDIVYAVAAVPSGLNESAWGAIADLGTANLESPSAFSDGYRSVVRYVDAPSMFALFACDSAFMAMDGLAEAAEWPVHVIAAKARVVKDAESFELVEGLANLSILLNWATVSYLLNDAAYFFSDSLVKFLEALMRLDLIAAAAYGVSMGGSIMVISSVPAAVNATVILAAAQLINARFTSLYAMSAREAEVWDGALPIVENADRLGVSP